MGDPVTPYVEQEGSSLLTSLRPAQDAVEIKTKITATASSLALPPHRFTESSTTSSRSAPPIQRAWPQRTVMTAPHSPSRATVEKNNNQPHLPTAHPHNHHPHTHLSTLNRQVSAHSSTFNQRTLESIRTTGLHARRSSTVDDVITELPSSKIPVTPTLDSSIFRRRFSSPSVAGPSPLKVKKSLDQLHSPTSPDRRRPKFTSRLANEPSSHSWLGSSHLAAPSLHAKVNKSDDEREVDDVEKKKAPGQTKRRNWWGTSLSRGRASGVRDAPLISMTPPPSTDPNPGLMGPPLPVPTGLSPPRQSTWSTSPSRIRPTLPSLTPLPQDPNNILPLSLPATPLPSSPVSRNSTPYHTPRPSVHDLTSEFKADYAVPSASSISGRTSTSTNSSMLGWGSCTGRSDSRSSADDDGSPVSGHGKSWWWANHAGSQDVPVSPKLAGPSTLQAPRIIRMASANRFLPTGTRNWAWLLELISGTFGSRSSDSASVTGSSSSRQRLRERERLMSNYPVRKKQSATFSGRVMVFVPTSPWSISLFFVLFAFFAAGPLTLKHILNPDKEALPWRSYCTSAYPTLYSLQDPNIPITPASAVDSTLTFASPPARNPAGINSFASATSSNLVLTPLTSQHPTWPYHPYPSPLFTADTFSSLDELEPVGILVGVFTTDESVQRRHMIRQSYSSHWRSRREGTEGVTVRFVMGRPRGKYVKAVQLEMEAFNDVILLDMPENMNSGKTHAFLSWAAENATVPDWEYPSHRRHVNASDGQDESLEAPIWRGEKSPAYVVKADEDSFIMLGELERHLRVAPRTKAYWGYLVKNMFMAGECYALSFDLVRYIAASPALRTMKHGKEDKLVSRWMRMHPEREEIVWIAERCWIYDHPKAGTVYSHGFLYPSTVSDIRAETPTGLAVSATSARGGSDGVDAYSTVSRFGISYKPPSSDMSATEEVEALVEGSPLSLLSANTSYSRSPGHAKHQAFSKVESIRHGIHRTFASRPSRTERFLGDPEEGGGTVVVHYIKKPDWFVETMIAFLGTAEEQGPSRRGLGTGVGSMGAKRGRVAGVGDFGGGVRVVKDAGL